MAANRYHKSKIYALRSHECKDIYVGATTQSLSRRLSNLRGRFKKWDNNKQPFKGYMRAYEILKHSDVYIELIEEFKCENKMLLDKREGEIIRSTSNCVNSRNNARSTKKNRPANKEHTAELKTKRVSQLNMIQKIIDETAVLKMDKVAC